MASAPGELLAIELPAIPVDTAERDRVYDGLTFDQAVHLDYERDRYMKHLADDQVLCRGRDVMRNVYQLDDLGRVALHPSEDLRQYWLERLTEVDHERVERAIPDDRFSRAVMSDFPYPIGSNVPARLAALVSRIPQVKPGCLVRYGKAEHIREAYELGRFLLRPASNCADSSLNAARQDDELGLAADVDTTFLRLIGPGAKRVGRRLSVSTRWPSDFYVLCTSACLRARLFLDFEADACLVIRQPEEFRNRFRRAVRRALPQYRMGAERVEYYDPLNVVPVEVKPAFWKHFRFAYQEEVRFVALPPQVSARLEPMFINLGSLSDISEIHQVD